jgi:hypothetical protein
MTTRVIQREFVVQPGDDTLPAVTLDYAWSSFMNTYAVWPAGAGDSVTIRRSISLQAGYYYVTGTVDNFGSVNINGEYNINLYNYDANISRTSIGNSTRIYHGGGPMTIVISATNTGGPRGVAVTVSKELETATGRRVITSTGVIAAQVAYETITSVGDLAWSTRSPGTATVGRYQVTMPFRANITAHVWGAGAGAGGLDATEGGRGSPGLYNTAYFQVERGDIVEVFVGSGGDPASPTVKRQGQTPGGPGGSSVINIDSTAIKSFNGGTGGRAGPAGWSGGGGGGGGASGVLVNGVPAVVAGGGGGGGGGGAARGASNVGQDGTITNNATGTSGTDYRGESGSSKSVDQGGADGGGAGGGGGGYPGGQGGGTPGGDIPGEAGQCGGNFPVFAASTGTNSPYYKSGYAGGSSPPNGTGQNGRVFLLIEPISLISVKVAGEWEQIQEAFVKVGGAWRDIDTIYIKIDDTWRELNGSGQGDVTLAGNTQSYGTSTRSFS